MPHHHHHPDHTVLAAGPSVIDWLIAAVALGALAAYLLAAGRLRRRGDAWPVSREVSFGAGAVALAVGVLIPLPGQPFTAHMAHHLIVAMGAPLLLVLGRPVTLAVRALPPRRPRRALLTTARSRPVRWLLFPPLAALLDIGGLWLLYRTPLAATAHHRPLLDAVVQVHVLLAGLLFTFTICQLDPVRHRWNLAWRGVTLLVAGAAHAVLAKSLYAAPPLDTAYTGDDLHTAAQAMYYGGDLVEVAIATVLAVQWYTATGRTHARRLRHTAPDLARSRL